MSINEIEFFVHAIICLNNSNIMTVGDLVMKIEVDVQV